MFGKKRKINRRFSYGGYKKYRTPLVFNSRKKIIKKKITLPPWKFRFKPIFYTAIFIFCIYFFLFSEKFSIKDVIVEGNHIVSAEKISDFVPMKKNIFRFNSAKAMENILKNNQEIKDVQIYRGIPNAIKIVVLEHDNKVVWQTNGSKYLVSVQGKVTKKINDGENYSLPEITDAKNIPVNIGDNILSPHFISFILNVNEKFYETTNIKPVRYEVSETTFDVNVYTEAGFYVKLNTVRSSLKQLENLKNVLVSKRNEVKEYIDLRVDGWAYYK